jgi:hypothetical protein
LAQNEGKKEGVHYWIEIMFVLKKKNPLPKLVVNQVLAYNTTRINETFISN